jgi:hypothetical protein
LIALALLAPLLTACTLGRPIESVREVAAAPATVAERVTAGFQRLGLDEPRDAGGGTLSTRLGHVRTDWARCRARLVSSGDGSRRMATAGRRFGEVAVSLAPVPAGTRVEVETKYTGVYRNTATGYTFQTPCESTGVIENRLVAAAAGEG